MKELAEALKAKAGLRMRQGVVSAVDGSTVSVLIGGSTVAVDGVHHLNSVAPQVGEVVWIASDGADLWILGTHGDPPPIELSRLPAFETYFTDADPDGAPAPVTGLTGATTRAGVLLSWDLPPEARWRRWEVYEGTAADFVPVTPILTTTVTVVAIPRDPGSGPWYYKVRALNTRDEASTDVQAGPFSVALIGEANLAADCVTAAKIRAGEITAAKLDVTDVQAAVVTAAVVNALELDAVKITGGEIEGVEITGSTLKTAQSPGARVEIDSVASNEIRLYSGSVDEVAPGKIESSVQEGFGPFLNFRSPVLAGRAVLTTALTGVNNDLTFLAKTAGAAGNDITVALVDPSANDQDLAVTVTDSAIEVSLATGPAGAITSTARDVRDAVNTDSEAAALVAASLAPGNDGSGVVTALAAANLAGGTDGAGGLRNPYGSMYLNPEAWEVVAGQDRLIGWIGVGDRAGLVGSPLGGLKVILGNLWATGGGIYQNKQMEPGDLHPPSLSMIRTLDLSVADNTITYVTMRKDAEVEWDTHGFWDGEDNNAGPVIGMQGIYLIEVAVEWAAKASGWREVGIAINGSVLVNNRTISPGNILCPMTISAMAELEPSDLVQIEVRHGGTGAALQLNAKTHTPRLQLTWLRHRPGYGIATSPDIADPWPGEYV